MKSIQKQQREVKRENKTRRKGLYAIPEITPKTFRKALLFGKFQINKIVLNLIRPLVRSQAVGIILKHLIIKQFDLIKQYSILKDRAQLVKDATFSKPCNNFSGIFLKKIPVTTFKELLTISRGYKR